MISAQGRQTSAALDDARTDHITSLHVDHIHPDFNFVRDHRPLGRSVFPVQDYRENQDVLVIPFGLRDSLSSVVRYTTAPHLSGFAFSGVVDDFCSVAPAPF